MKRRVFCSWYFLKKIINQNLDSLKFFCSARVAESLKNRGLGLEVHVLGVRKKL